MTPNAGIQRSILGFNIDGNLGGVKVFLPIWCLYQRGAGTSNGGLGQGLIYGPIQGFEAVAGGLAGGKIIKNQMNTILG